METLSGDISAMVFKASVKDSLGKVILTGQMIGVMTELDGRKPLSSIARTLGMNMASLRPVIFGLMELQLIQVAKESTDILGEEFFDFLTVQLSRTTGPIAQVMIEDAVQEIGGSSMIPKGRAAEVVEILARQIPKKGQRSDFIKAMMEKIKEIQRERLTGGN